MGGNQSLEILQQGSTPDNRNQRDRSQKNAEYDFEESNTVHSRHAAVAAQNAAARSTQRDKIYYNRGLKLNRGNTGSSSGAENLPPMIQENDSISPLPPFLLGNPINSHSPHISSPMKQPTASTYLSNTKSNYKSFDNKAVGATSGSLFG